MIYKNWYVFCFSVDCRLATRQSTEKHNTQQLLYIYSIPTDDGLQTCPKHVEVDWWNKRRINSASSWCSLHGFHDMSHPHKYWWNVQSVTTSHKATWHVLAKQRTNAPHARKKFWEVTKRSKNIMSFRLKRGPFRILVPFSTVAGFTSYDLFN